MTERDTAAVRARETKAPDDISCVRNLRTTVNMAVKVDRAWSLWQAYEECGTSSKQLWAQTHAVLGKTKTGAPSWLLVDGNMVTKPCLITQALNNEYTDHPLCL